MNQKNRGAALERFREAISIFEFNIDNQGPAVKHDDIIQCYVNLLDLEEEQVISESRADGKSPKFSFNYLPCSAS